MAPAGAEARRRRRRCGWSAARSRRAAGRRPPGAARRVRGARRRRGGEAPRRRRRRRADEQTPDEAASAAAATGHSKRVPARRGGGEAAKARHDRSARRRDWRRRSGRPERLRRPGAHAGAAARLETECARRASPRKIERQASWVRATAQAARRTRREAAFAVRDRGSVSLAHPAPPSPIAAASAKAPERWRRPPADRRRRSASDDDRRTGAAGSVPAPPPPPPHRPQPARRRRAPPRDSPLPCSSPPRGAHRAAAATGAQSLGATTQLGRVDRPEEPRRPRGGAARALVGVDRAPRPNRRCRPSRRKRWCPPDEGRDLLCR